MFKGIHASAKSQWLETVCSNMSVLKNMSYAMDRLGLLEDLASQINGIGKATVLETFLYIENSIDSL